jgi:hypothetical protein
MAAVQDNFRLYAVDAWANSAWRVIDQGSKQGTRRAWARLRVGPGLWFLVVDNRADDYDVLPSGPASGPALLHLSFNTSSATILVPPDSDKKPPSGDDASPGDDGGGVADKNARADRSIVVRSAPVLRWSLLLFFAALPGKVMHVSYHNAGSAGWPHELVPLTISHPHVNAGWPLWRHYSIMVEYAGGCGPAGGLWAWLPFVACAGAAVRVVPFSLYIRSFRRSSLRPAHTCAGCTAPCDVGAVVAPHAAERYLSSSVSSVTDAPRRSLCRYSTIQVVVGVAQSPGLIAFLYPN